eukprot:NODE_1396_length_1153_cov_0.534156.p1 type:complete len:104 gc:universal NODE_1396_length_1153_cov_0.534156:818-507(-)
MLIVTVIVFAKLINMPFKSIDHELEQAMEIANRLQSDAKSCRQQLAQECTIDQHTLFLATETLDALVAIIQEHGLEPDFLTYIYDCQNSSNHLKKRSLSPSRI